MTGARIVAKSWLDREFKAKLLKDARGAVRKWMPSLLTPGNGEPIDTWNVTHLEVLENTENLRNVVVCTLCSCYPRGMLGEPPEWYTSDDYKERVIREPKKVLTEMGNNLKDGVKVRVYDSTADIRYLVIPERPRGTKGWSEEQLAKLVTRDSLIGVSDALKPN